MADKSLVLTGEAAGTARYRLLEPVRQYALERLRWQPQAGLEARFIDHFAERGLAQLDRLCGAGREVAMRELEADLGNLRGAWAMAVERADIGALDRLARGLWWYWNFSNRFNEGHSLCRQALDALASVSEGPGYLAHAMGALEWIRGDQDSASAMDFSCRYQIMLRC